MRIISVHLNRIIPILFCILTLISYASVLYASPKNDNKLLVLGSYTNIKQLKEMYDTHKTPLVITGNKVLLLDKSCIDFRKFGGAEGLRWYGRAEESRWYDGAEGARWYDGAEGSRWYGGAEGSRKLVGAEGLSRKLVGAEGLSRKIVVAEGARKLVLAEGSRKFVLAEGSRKLLGAEGSRKLLGAKSNLSCIALPNGAGFQILNLRVNNLSIYNGSDIIKISGDTVTYEDFENIKID